MTENTLTNELEQFRAFLEAIRPPNAWSFIQGIKNKDHFKGGGSKFVMWFEGGQLPTIKTQKGIDVYFGVNATGQALKSGKGYATPPTEDDIAYIKCLYGDFDAKGLDKIHELQYPPQVVIETSPQKYHCYFILKRPIQVTEKNRNQLKEVMGFWVSSIGADERAKDLRRILRVAGTFNYKKDYEVEGQAFEVRFIKCDLDPNGFYSYPDLQSIALQYARKQAKTKERRDSISQRSKSESGVTDTGIVPQDSLEKMYQSCIERVASAGNGQRNHEVNKITYWLARWAARGFFNESDIRRDIFSAASQNGYVNEHGDNDVYRVIESALQSGKQNPISDMEINRMKRSGQLDWQSHRDLNLSSVPDDVENIITNAKADYDAALFALKVLEGTETIDPPVPCLIPPMQSMLPYHPIGELTAIAGGTGTGKTIFIGGMVNQVVTVLGESCYVYSKEWQRNEWASRRLLRDGGLSQFEIDANTTYHSDIEQGVTPSEARGEPIPDWKVQIAQQKVREQLSKEKGRVFIPSNYSVGFIEIMEDIRNVVYRERAKGHTIRTAFVDYLQVFPPRMGNEFSFYEYLSDTLAEVAHELRLAVFVCSQLTAESERRLRDNIPAVTHSMRYISANQYKSVLTLQLKYAKVQDVPIPYVDDDGRNLGRIWLTKSNKNKSMVPTKWFELELNALKWGF